MRRKSNYIKQSSQSFKVEHDSTLLAYMIELWPQKSRTEIKSYLPHRRIQINGQCQTAFDFKLKKGDTLTLNRVGEQKQNPNHRLRIVFEDEYIIVAEKKNGLLTMSTGKEGEQTAYSILMEHVRRRGPENRIFIVHRIDRDTSGLLIFAKSEQMQEALQSNWEANIIHRKYIAIVEGTLENENGQIVSWLKENPKSLKMYSSLTDNGGKKAITNYRVIKSNEIYSLVEVELETGRKNQIRVQFEQIGHPIAGDKKYGATSNPIGRLCLHAQTLEFIHPATGETMKFDTGIPTAFQ